MALDRDSMSKVLSDPRLSNGDSPTNLAVVQNAYRALASGSIEAMAEFLHDTVELEIHDTTGLLGGHWTGREAVIAAMIANFGKVDQQQPQIKGMIADGSSVAVLFSETGIVKESRRRYSANGVQWFTIARGKMLRIEEFLSMEF